MHRSLAAAAALTLALGAPALAQSGPNASNPNPTTIFKNNLPEGPGIVVRIDGHETDRLRSATYDYLRKVVHPGQNTLTVTWSQPVSAFDFEVAYASSGNNFKTLVHVKTTSAQDPTLSHPGSKTITFTIPG